MHGLCNSDNVVQCNILAVSCIPIWLLYYFQNIAMKYWTSTPVLVTLQEMQMHKYFAAENASSSKTLHSTKYYSETSGTDKDQQVKTSLEGAVKRVPLCFTLLSKHPRSYLAKCLSEAHIRPSNLDMWDGQLRYVQREQCFSKCYANYRVDIWIDQAKYQAKSKNVLLMDWPWSAWKNCFTMIYNWFYRAQL